MLDTYGTSNDCHARDIPYIRNSTGLGKILTPKDTLCNILCSYQKGLAYLALQQYDLAVDIFTNKKMSLIRSTFGVNHPFYLDYLNELGVAYLWAGKLNEAIAEFKEAISIADSTKQERDLYLYYHNLGRAIMLTMINKMLLNY